MPSYNIVVFPGDCSGPEVSDRRKGQNRGIEADVLDCGALL